MFGQKVSVGSFKCYMMFGRKENHCGIFQMLHVWTQILCGIFQWLHDDNFCMVTASVKLYTSTPVFVTLNHVQDQTRV